MATYAENLVTLRGQTLALLMQVREEQKPSYSVNGQTIHWTEYAAKLREELKDLDNMIAAAGGPVEVLSQGYT